MLRSRLPNLEQFQHWVCSEVLPKIRNMHPLTIERMCEIKNMPINTEGFVYLATTELYEKYNIYKIGNTKNLMQRLQNLQVAHVEEIYYIYTIKVSDCTMMEKLLHEHFAQNNCVREFFKMTDEEVDRFPTACADLEEIFF